MAEPAPLRASPSGDDDTTTTTGPGQLCPVCWTAFTRIGRQLYCCDRCRKTAWIRRHTPAALAAPVPPARPRRDVTIYSCPTCGQR